jgi:hypothetical protein
MDLLRLIEINGIGLGLVAMGLVLWISLGRLVAQNGRSRWWAALVGLPLLLAGALLVAYWLVFFSSERMAVIAHATRLSLGAIAGPVFTWVAVLWLLLSLWLVVRAALPPRT